MNHDATSAQSTPDRECSEKNNGGERKTRQDERLLQSGGFRFEGRTIWSGWPLADVPIQRGSDRSVPMSFWAGWSPFLPAAQRTLGSGVNEEISK